MSLSAEKEMRSDAGAIFMSQGRRSLECGLPRALRVGPIEVTVVGDAPHLDAAWTRLHEGFSSPERLQVPRCFATVEFLPWPAATQVLGTDVPSFLYDAESETYGWANDLVQVTMRFESARCLLSAGLREGHEVKDLFAKSMIHTAAAMAGVRQGSLLVHGCAMVSPTGQTVLFLGASGDGKTTMLHRLPGWTPLADDTVLLECGRPTDGLWVSGTPFSGSEGHPRIGEPHRLDRLVVLRPRQAEMRLEPMDVGEVFTSLSARVFCPVLDGPLPTEILGHVERATHRVSGFRLESDLSHDIQGLFDGPVAR